MSTEQNKAFVQRYLAAISGEAKTAELIERFVADPALRSHIEAAERGFPRYRIEASDLVAEADRVAVRFSCHVRHTGEFMGAPPSGREASFEGIAIYRIEGEKIVDHWLQFDTPALMQQLGLMPATTA